MNQINLSRDLRFSNPFRGDWDKFNSWIYGQPYLVQLIQWLATNDWKFHGGDSAHADIIHYIAQDYHYKEPVFVFGSNLKGVHGSGTAKFARDYCGAQLGVGNGPTGNAYALPIKDESITTMSPEIIEGYIEQFLDYVLESAPDAAYQVTRLGCGRGGYTDKQMINLFQKVLGKTGMSEHFLGMILPEIWRCHLTQWSRSIIVAGSRTLQSNDCKLLIERMIADGPTIPIKRIISGRAKGVDRVGEDIAVDKGIDLLTLPAHWERFGKTAGYLRNYEMGYHASELIAIWDGCSKGTGMMIDIAKDSGLHVRVKKIVES